MTKETRFSRFSMCALLTIIGVASFAQTQIIVPGATIPQVVSSNPPNGSNASASLQQISITFDQPMNATTFYWLTPATSDFPQVTGKYYWTNGNKTFVLPVALQVGFTYRIPLNVNDQAFKSAAGVPLSGGYITFATTTNAGVAVPRGGTAPGGTINARTPSPFGGPVTGNVGAGIGAINAGGTVNRGAVQNQPTPVVIGGAAAAPTVTPRATIRTARRPGATPTPTPATRGQ
jgi:hypothetical protein